jgi:uncharacterized protein (DUF2461 family)
VFRINRDVRFSTDKSPYKTPAIEYLKLKSFTVSHSIPDSVLTMLKLSATVQAAFASLQPLVEHLNRALV